MTMTRPSTEEDHWYDQDLEAPPDQVVTREDFTDALRTAILAMEGITRALGNKQITNVRVSFETASPTGKTFNFNYSSEEESDG